MQAKTDKSDQELRQMHTKLTDSESMTNQMRRVMQSITEEKKSLENKLEASSQDKDALNETIKNLKSEHLEA